MTEEKSKNKNYRYKNVKSANGKFSSHLSKEVNDRLTEYCKAKNLNKTNYVNQIVMERLDNDLNEMYSSMTKEELIQYMNNRRSS